MVSALSFQELFAKGDYGTLCLFGKANRPADFQELYVYLRSAIILGEYSQAQSVLENEALWIGSPVLRKFLTLQLQVYSNAEPLESALNELISLRKNLPSAPFYEGEARFVLGFTCMSLNRYGAAMGHFRKAIDSYEKTNAQVAKAHAIFNLGVCFKHLNYRTLFDETCDQLKDCGLKTNNPSVQVAVLRMQSNRALDCESYLNAKASLLKLEELCIQLRRFRDLASLRCSLVFALANLPGEEETLKEVIVRARKDLNFGSRQHETFLQEVEYLVEQSFLDEKQLQRRFSSWKTLHSIHVLRLYFLAADKLARAQNYEWLWKISTSALHLAVKTEQAPCLIDFRYFEALSLLKRGDSEKAARIIHAYKSDAIQMGASTKLKKVEELETLLDSSLLSPFRNQNEEIIRLKLDPIRFSLTLDGNEIDLKRSPLLYRFFVSLTQSRNGLTLSQLHSEIYGIAYYPERHEKRLISLLERARNILGGATFIHRASNLIRLDERVIAEVKTQSGRLRQREMRYERIKGTIERSKVPLSISSLEPLFRGTRRTLQLDLNHLVRTSQISYTGSTRNRKYFMEKSL